MARVCMGCHAACQRMRRTLVGHPRSSPWWAIMALIALVGYHA